MNIPESPITRRTALMTAGGVAAGIALAGTAVAGPAMANGRKPTPTPWHSRLTTRQQAGQRVIYSYPGATPPASLFDAIAAGEAGGVIFFGENITSLTQIASVVADLRAAEAHSPVKEPLLYMTDQEGGYIRRLRGQEPVLSEKAIGLAADPDAEATKAGAGAAAALRNVGMKLNLAPVQDVFRVPDNFDDQWERSYSSDPAVCGRLGSEMVKAQQGAGVSATAKHFPGLGAATQAQNTDLGPVTLTQSLSELRSVDESAFAPVIRAGVDLVMTSWALYPAIDRVYPAGLSSRIIGGELRGRLRFSGVTITDALEAGAISSFGDTGTCTLLAADAGMDLLLCSARDMSQGQDAVAALTAALGHGWLNPGHAQQALSRVQRLRSRLF